MLPGTGSLEIAAEAFATIGENEAFEIKEVYFFRPLDVDQKAPREVRAKTLVSRHTGDIKAFETGLCGFHRARQAPCADISAALKALGSKTRAQAAHRVAQEALL